MPRETSNEPRLPVAQSAELPRASVLVVEDSPSDTFLIQRVLARATPALECRFSTTIADALQVAQRAPPDIVLLDLSLPDSHGVRTLQRFREACPAPPVVVLTGHSELKLAIQSLRAGARDYLLKGEIANLEPTLRRVLTEVRSERQRQESEANRLTKLKLESVGRLAAGVAHEINTPLQFISDNLVFLRRAMQLIEPPLARIVGARSDAGPAATPNEVAKLAYVMEQVVPAIDQALDGVNRVAHLTSTLRAQDRQPGEKRTPIQLREVIEAGLARCRESGVPEAAIDLQCDTELPAIRVFAQDLSAAFAHIIINAREAIARGPRCADGRLRISVSRRGEHLDVSFDDDGPGIPEQHLRKIFDPFFTTKTVGGGMGQGLAIAYQTIVQEHGGELTAHSAPGRGATFTASLPLVVPHEGDL